MLISRSQIEACIDIPTAIPLIEEGFVLFSKGEAVVPPFGSLHFNKPKGDVHIKYGYIKEQDFYVVKVASSFYENPKLGKSSSQGVILVFSRITGELHAVLNDEGYLTGIRTAAAGAVAAKYLAPKKVKCIGIVGTGTQAFYQLLALRHVVDCKKVVLWGRNQESLRQYVRKPEFADLEIIATQDMSRLTWACNLIVTTTPSSTPLLFASQVQPGTHITAVGADDIGKQELDYRLFKFAHVVAVDSRQQCFNFGDSSFAIRNGELDANKVFELGEIIQKPCLGRTTEQQITIADFTGIAVQDVQIANAVVKKLEIEAVKKLEFE